MDPTYVPGGQDASMLMENAITKTADFTGTVFDNGSGFAPGGIGLPVAAVVDVTTFALGGSTGASTWAGKLQESPDNNTSSTWTDIGPSISFTATGCKSVPGILSQRYVRLNLDVAGGTGTGTMTLSAWLTPKGFSLSG